MRLIPVGGTRLRRRFVLLAPEAGGDTALFSNATADASLHQRLLAEAQKFRGRTYLQDGAIQPAQLRSDGRHVQAADQLSWHLLTLDERGHVAACTRYLAHVNAISFTDLTVSHSALATSDTWALPFRRAIEAELRLAQRRRCSYVEMGGWVISEALRCTTEAVRMVLAAYGLAQLLGGALGISTVTTRHGSSSILRRIGGNSLLSRGVELPPYYDPYYRCEMEILRFDSARPSPRYRAWIEDSKAYLETVPVICAKAAGKSLEETLIAVPERFRHTDQTSTAVGMDEAGWQRSTGVA